MSRCTNSSFSKASAHDMPREPSSVRNSLALMAWHFARSFASRSSTPWEPGALPEDAPEEPLVAALAAGRAVASAAGGQQAPPADAPGGGLSASAAGVASAAGGQHAPPGGGVAPSRLAATSLAASSSLSKAFAVLMPRSSSSFLISLARSLLTSAKSSASSPLAAWRVSSHCFGLLSCPKRAGVLTANAPSQAVAEEAWRQSIAPRRSQRESWRPCP
mmetsp:Transcript_49866/g.108404  ORF Transcript_49866/g.108404 Transcript_49866/m.108404 type:complete len:218 (+) Transcript_49866:622-1275(+)